MEMEANGSVSRSERPAVFSPSREPKKAEDDPLSARLCEEHEEILLKTTQAPELLRLLLKE